MVQKTELCELSYHLSKVDISGWVDPAGQPVYGVGVVLHRLQQPAVVAGVVQLGTPASNKIYLPGPTVCPSASCLPVYDGSQRIPGCVLLVAQGSQQLQQEDSLQAGGQPVRLGPAWGERGGLL